EGRRLDDELLGEVALTQDLHRLVAAGHHAGALQRRQVDRAGREALLERADVDGEDLRAERVLEALLAEAALHGHLAALEAEARAVVTRAGLLALDALAGLLARARAHATADALAVTGRAARALESVKRGSHCYSAFSMETRCDTERIMPRTATLSGRTTL